MEGWVIRHQHSGLDGGVVFGSTVHSYFLNLLLATGKSCQQKKKLLAGIVVLIQGTVCWSRQDKQGIFLVRPLPGSEEGTGGDYKRDEHLFVWEFLKNLYRILKRDPLVVLV